MRQLNSRRRPILAGKMQVSNCFNAIRWCKKGRQNQHQLAIHPNFQGLAFAPNLLTRHRALGGGIQQHIARLQRWHALTSIFQFG